MAQLFDKVLIANRGEIALRIMRSLKKLGIKSVAVYSEADTNALHVQYADEAYFIGNSPATESYLSISNIINAISISGAQAVHPGYGFLSENPNFAIALKREGVTLIGPSSNSIKKMGDKIEAKKIAIEAGVSIVPGYMGTIDKPEKAIEIAQNIGFPVIVKAAAGGGGRGMRVVKTPEAVVAAFNSAKLEASSSFNDSRVFIEKFIENPRHIEIQVIADHHGNVVCLGERECSIQRHHQKIIEEAPSPCIDEKTRADMYSQVIALVQKVGYYSAGTVEFILDSNKNFFFLEMNTRLQVEHPVTELITGVDLVEEMIRIAAGEKLSFSQDDIKFNGWAIECRIYSEDPSRGFLPSSGRIIEYQEPLKSSNIRVDSGVGPGCEVSMFYDAMIAKLCTYAETRNEAIEHMKSALSTYVIDGISHNMNFLEAVISHDKFISGDINTNFLSQEYPEGFTGAELTSETTENFLASALHVFLSEQTRMANISGQLNNQAHKIGTRWVVTIGAKQFPVITQSVQDGYNIRQDNNRIRIKSNWKLGNKLFNGFVNGRKIHVKIEQLGTGYQLTHGGIVVDVYVRSPRIAELEGLLPKIDPSSEDSNELYAPLTGQIIAVKVAVGDKVMPGQELMILTAMKLENTIVATKEAVVAEIHVKNEDQVAADQLLLEFKDTD